MSGIIEELVRYLNNKYGLPQAELSGVSIGFPKIDVIDKETVISFWKCGAIVMHKNDVYDVRNFNGHWLENDKKYNQHSIELEDSRSNAYQCLINYLKEHGYPRYTTVHVDEFERYVSMDDVCGYSLVESNPNNLKRLPLPYCNLIIQESSINIKTNSFNIVHKPRRPSKVFYFDGGVVISFIALSKYKHLFQVTGKLRNYTIITKYDTYKCTFRGCTPLNVSEFNETHSYFEFNAPVRGLEVY